MQEILRAALFGPGPYNKHLKSTQYFKKKMAKPLIDQFKYSLCGEGVIE